MWWNIKQQSCSFCFFHKASGRENILNQVICGIKKQSWIISCLTVIQVSDSGSEPHDRFGLKQMYLKWWHHKTTMGRLYQKWSSNKVFNSWDEKDIFSKNLKRSKINADWDHFSYDQSRKDVKNCKMAFYSSILPTEFWGKICISNAHNVVSTHSVQDSLVLAGTVGRGDALRAALIGRDPQALALWTHTHTKITTLKTVWYVVSKC